MAGFQAYGFMSECREEGDRELAGFPGGLNAYFVHMCNCVCSECVHR